MQGQRGRIILIVFVILVLLAINYPNLKSIARQPSQIQINTEPPLLFIPIFTANTRFTIPNIPPPAQIARPIIANQTLVENFRRQPQGTVVPKRKFDIDTSTSGLSIITQTVSPAEAIARLKSFAPTQTPTQQAGITDLSSSLDSSQLRVFKNVSLSEKEEDNDDEQTDLPLSIQPDQIPSSGRYIFVHQDNQSMHIYENGIEIKTLPASTGRPESNAFTPSWSGQVGNYWGAAGFVDGSLKADYIWYLYDGPEGAILIHSVPYRLAGQDKVYDQLDALGVSPVSNGCIRISPEDAAWLQSWDPRQVPIVITRLNQQITQIE